MRFFKKRKPDIPVLETKRYLFTVVVEGAPKIVKEFQWSALEDKYWSFSPKDFMLLKVANIIKYGITDKTEEGTVHYSPKIIKTVTYKEIEPRTQVRSDV